MLLEEARKIARRESHDWSQVVHIADYDGLSPLIYDVLRDEDMIPATTLETLHGRYVTTASRNMVLLHELETLLRQPALNDVQVIVLKGAALLENIYRGIALRPMIDLDLFSRPQSVLTIQACLESLDYVPLPEPITDSQLALRNELRLLKSQSGGVWLDLHWDLFNSPYLANAISSDWLWETAQQASFGRGQALILGAEAQLLHLCGHMWLHHHVHRKLLWLYDLSELIHTYASSMDWEELLSRASSYNLVIPLQKTLPTLARDWAAPIPVNVLEQCMALSVSPEEERAFAWHTSRDRASDELIRAHLGRQESFGWRLSYLRTRLLPTPAFMRIRYDIRHPLLLPLFYLHRLGVGVSIGLKMLWNRGEVSRSLD